MGKTQEGSQAIGDCFPDDAASRAIGCGAMTPGRDMPPPRRSATAGGRCSFPGGGSGLWRCKDKVVMSDATCLKAHGTVPSLRAKRGA